MGVRRGIRVMAAAAALAAAAACSNEHAPQRHEIALQAFGFVPAVQAAAPGDTLVFVNHDAVPHTATALDGSWDTGNMPANTTRTVIVPAAGGGDYRCTFHPTMTGRIEAAK
jgi:plastocyanin